MWSATDVQDRRGSGAEKREKRKATRTMIRTVWCRERRRIGPFAGEIMGGRIGYRMRLFLRCRSGARSAGHSRCYGVTTRYIACTMRCTRGSSAGRWVREGESREGSGQWASEAHHSANAPMLALNTHVTVFLVARSRSMRLASTRRQPPNHRSPIRPLALTMSSAVITRLQDLSVSLFLSPNILLRRKSSSTTQTPSKPPLRHHETTRNPCPGPAAHPLPTPSKSTLGLCLR